MKGQIFHDSHVAIAEPKIIDSAHPSYQHVASLLENGVAALLYSGARDFICNAKVSVLQQACCDVFAYARNSPCLQGNERWIELLEWSGQEGYQNEHLKPWHANSGHKQAVSGNFKTYGNLTFATVAEASHFVPFSKPEESLVM